MDLNNTLDLEALAAVKEMADRVRSINISEVLARTDHLIFLNLETLEGDIYCIELTGRGWRICSDKHDCMEGDFRRELHHCQYYETIHSLLDVVSLEYRQSFANALSDKLKNLQNHLGGAETNTKERA